MKKALIVGVVMLSVGLASYSYASYEMTEFWGLRIKHDATAIVETGKPRKTMQPFKSEINFFDINSGGDLKYRSTYHLRSNDYYSSRNYASRLIGDKLVFYTPQYIYSDAKEQFPTAMKNKKQKAGGRQFLFCLPLPSYCLLPTAYEFRAFLFPA